MSQVKTGARVALLVNNTKIAFASNCNYTENHIHQPIYVLDQLEVVEHAETSYSVEFSCSNFRVANQSAVSIGIQPKLQNILTQPELTAELQDGIDGTTLMFVTGVKFTTRSGSVDSQGVFTETWNFVGRVMTDEEGP